MSAAAMGVYKVIREGAQTVLHVRCNEGTVRCGTVFHQAYFTKRWHRDGPAMSVLLMVVRIVLYGRDFEWLDEGLTGAVTVSGDVPGLLDEGWVLTE